MGNCINTVDPLITSLPKSIHADTSPIRESSLPIIFLIGGPGVGKKTICSKVAEKYGFLSIISTELIRHEVSTRTERAFAIARMMSQGRLIPTHVLIELITIKMIEYLNKKKGFIVSGFPLKREQCKVFDKEIRQPDLVVFLKARNSVLSDRIMASSITTRERLSMNFESIKKRIKEFHKRKEGIMKYYKKLLVVVDGEPDVMTVYENVCQVIDNLLLNLPATSTQSNNIVPVNDL